MKKLFILSTVLLTLFFTVNAQGPRFGFTAGAAIANYKGSDASDNGNSKIGLTGGLLVDIPVGNHLSFQPAVNFVQKGTKDEQTYGGVTEKYSLNVNSIEVPLNLLFNTNGISGNFFLGAGPSIAFGISGKLKYDDGTDVINESINFGNTDDDDIKGMDFGANFIAGYSFGNGLLFSVNYNTGLSNLIPGDAGGDKIKSHYFGIRLGYFLNGKDKK